MTTERAPWSRAHSSSATASSTSASEMYGAAKIRFWYSVPQSSTSQRLKARNMRMTPPGSCFKQVLVDHAQRREEPDLLDPLRVHDLEAGVAIPVLGTDRLGRAEELERGAPVGIAPEVLHQGAGRGHGVEGGIGDGAADAAADGVVLAASHVDPLDDPGPVGRVQVPGEGVERLVVVVVGVKDR